MIHKTHTCHGASAFLLYAFHVRTAVDVGVADEGWDLVEVVQEGSAVPKVVVALLLLGWVVC